MPLSTVWGQTGIYDHPPVDDYHVLQPCWPFELEGVVKEAGVPQGRQGHRYACPAPVSELASDGDLVRPWVVVDKVDGKPVDQRRAHGAEQTQELLHLVLQVRLRGLLEAVPPSRKAPGGLLVLPLRHFVVPSQGVARGLHLAQILLH